MIYKILKKIFAFMFTVVLLPVWAIWFMFDVMFGDERLKEVMDSMWN